jgi:hypothetical protein
MVPSGLGSQLALVDFSARPEFASANLSIKAKPSAGTTGGAALVQVGYINATGIDLRKVIVQGDLGQIDAGDDLHARTRDPKSQRALASAVMASLRNCLTARCRATSRAR